MDNRKKRRRKAPKNTKVEKENRKLQEILDILAEEKSICNIGLSPKLKKLRALLIMWKRAKELSQDERFYLAELMTQQITSQWHPMTIRS